MKQSARDQIIEAAFAVFAETPTATLSQVAESAGVGRATLHRHFDGREDLMEALALTAMRELDTAVEEATRDATSYGEGLRIALEAMIPLADRQLFLANEPLDRNPKIAAAYQEQLDDLATDIDRAKAEGVFAQNLPTAWIVAAYENLTYAAWTLVRNGDATSRQAAALAWQTLTDGLNGDNN